ncbi:MAG: helix-turn-helix protein [Mucilaginibacter sp.]|nr:helix-turn-helix protein [Mucilaginibacter sp.]
MARFRQFSFKQFGYLNFNHDLPRQLSQQDFTSFVKIVFLRASGHAVIDFKEYQALK